MIVLPSPNIGGTCSLCPIGMTITVAGQTQFTVHSSVLCKLIVACVGLRQEVGAETSQLLTADFLQRCAAGQTDFTACLPDALFPGITHARNDKVSLRSQVTAD